jgi:hypothetical protein
MLQKGAPSIMVLAAFLPFFPEFGVDEELQTK